jgi:hypothetical protein
MTHARATSGSRWSAGQPFRIRQGDEMASGNFLHLSEPFTRDTPSGAQHVLRHVVQKVRFNIEFRRIAAARRSLFARFERSCGAPPCTSHLSGLGDHRVDEHDHPHGRTHANEGRREAR